MKRRRIYHIDFKSLSNGKHNYHYDIDNSFFQLFDNNEITEGRLQVDIVLDRQISLMVLDFTLKGVLEVSCDRCLAPLDVEVDTVQRLIVGFGESTYEESAEKIILAENEDYLDAGQFIYEFAGLAIPLKRVHPDDEEGYSTCDEEMLDKLDNYTPHTENTEADPRWDALKNLLN